MFIHVFIIALLWIASIKFAHVTHTQVLEGYGSTETTAVASLQYIGDGTAGNCSHKNL